MLAPNERTRHIYEHIPAYKHPPQVPLVELSLPRVLKSLHIKNTILSRCALWILSGSTGFARFYKQLPQRIDELLTTSDLRRSCLQAPVISATLALNDDARMTDPLDRAVSLLLGSKNFYDELISGRLEQDRYRDSALEMGQYPNLFSTNLTVQDKKSRIFKSAKTDQITVLVNAQIYIISILDWDDDALSSKLKATLRAIVNHNSSNQQEQAPIGMVTAASQVVQVRGFFRLQKNSENQKNLDILKHSFLALCLDLEQYPKTDAESIENSHSKNPENRWSWQSLQFVVHGNGRACAICNFSAYLDGNTMMRGAAEICERAAHVLVPTDDGAPLPFEILKWHVNSQLIEAAHKDIMNFMDSQQATFVFSELSKTMASKLNLDPIGLFVIALCMTTKHYINKIPVVHQFLTMSKYRYMDLTTAIVSTPEVQTLCEFMDQKEKDSHRGYELMQNAIESQKLSCREERSALSLYTVYSMFLMSLRGVQKIWAGLIFALVELLLRKTNHLKAVRREIVISHPAIYPQVSLVGRPGIRLPYVNHFALHYQIWEDKTCLTMMPGTRWPIKNKEFVSTLRENIKELFYLASAGM